MPRLLQDLRFGLRSFIKAPGFTGVAILVLAVGIGVNTATFTIVNALLFTPMASQEEGVVGLFRYKRSTPDSYRAFAYPNFTDVRDSADAAAVFDGIAAHTFSMAGVPAGEGTRRIFVELITANYFQTLRVGLAAGRAFLPEEERPRADRFVAIAGYEAWRARGLDPAFVGSTMTINGLPFTVIGVAPEGFGGLMALASPEVWLPLGVFDTVVNDIFKNTGDGLDDREAGTVIAFGRLKPGMSLETASARIDALSLRMAAASTDAADQAIAIQPLPRLSTSTTPRTDEGLGIASAALMGLTGTVLLIACLNLANMLLARGAARKKEIALRLALGGSRARIVRQLLTESLLLAAAGAAAGLILASWSTSLIVASLARVLPVTLNIETTPDLNVLLATAGFVAAATLFAGVGPALRLSRVDLVTDLKEQGAQGGVRPGRFAARNVLVVAQLALSLGLLSAGGLFARSAVRAAESDPGFKLDRAMMATLDAGIARMSESRGRDVYRTVLERVRALPGVEAAGLASTVPLGNFHESRVVERPGMARDPDAASPTYRIISAGYFQAMGMRLLAGREFSEAEESSPNAPRVAIIDTVLAAQLFPNDSAIGQTIRFVEREGSVYGSDTAPLEIVGVAPTMIEELMDKSGRAHVYVPFGSHYRAGMTLHVRAASAAPEALASLIDPLRQTLRGVDANLPIMDLMTLQRFHDQSLELWALRTGSQTFGLIGLLALGLAVAGVYGVQSYLVSQRTREIGIRMALGASSKMVFRMVLRESAGLTLAGLALGLPLVWVVSRTIGSVLIGVSGFEPLVFVGAPALLAGAAILASIVPARRVTRVNPLTALRG